MEKELSKLIVISTDSIEQDLLSTEQNIESLKNKVINELKNEITCLQGKIFKQLRCSINKKNKKVDNIEKNIENTLQYSMDKEVVVESIKNTEFLKKIINKSNNALSIKETDFFIVLKQQLQDVQRMQGVQGVQIDPKILDEYINYCEKIEDMSKELKKLTKLKDIKNELSKKEKNAIQKLINKKEVIKRKDELEELEKVLKGEDAKKQLSKEEKNAIQKLINKKEVIKRKDELEELEKVLKGEKPGIIDLISKEKYKYEVSEEIKDFAESLKELALKLELNKKVFQKTLSYIQQKEFQEAVYKNNSILYDINFSFSVNDKKYEFKKYKVVYKNKIDLRGFFLGKYTGCSLSITGAESGNQNKTDKLIFDAMTKPSLGFYIITDEKDNIIAAQYAWLTKNRDLVLETFECSTKIKETEREKLFIVSMQELKKQSIMKERKLYVDTGQHTPKIDVATDETLLKPEEQGFIPCNGLNTSRYIIPEDLSTINLIKPKETNSPCNPKKVEDFEKYITQNKHYQGYMFRKLCAKDFSEEQKKILNNNLYLIEQEGLKSLSPEKLFSMCKIIFELNEQLGKRNKLAELRELNKFIKNFMGLMKKEEQEREKNEQFYTCITTEPEYYLLLAVNSSRNELMEIYKQDTGFFKNLIKNGANILYLHQTNYTSINTLLNLYKDKKNNAIYLMENGKKIYNFCTKYSFSIEEKFSNDENLSYCINNIDIIDCLYNALPNKEDFNKFSLTRYKKFCGFT